MNLTIWRIEKARYASEVRSGEGARRIGGRWTSPGRPAIYCAEHLSLAVLEILVHAPDPNQRSAPRLRYRITIDASFVETVAGERLPADYSPRTPYDVTRAVGDEWLSASRTPALSAPSAIVTTERTYILNPAHPNFGRLVWERASPLALDDRLWTAG